MKVHQKLRFVVSLLHLQLPIQPDTYVHKHKTDDSEQDQWTICFRLLQRLLPCGMLSPTFSVLFQMNYHGLFCWAIFAFSSPPIFFLVYDALHLAYVRSLSGKQANRGLARFSLNTEINFTITVIYLFIVCVESINFVLFGRPTAAGCLWFLIMTARGERRYR